MAISVGRVSHRELARHERIERYGTRLVALAAYVSALAFAFVLLAPAFTGGEAPAAPAPTPVTRMASVEPGATLETIAAENGVSVGWLLALNPGLGPFSLAGREQVRVG